MNLWDKHAEIWKKLTEHQDKKPKSHDTQKYKRWETEHRKIVSSLNKVERQLEKEE